MVTLIFPLDLEAQETAEPLPASGTSEQQSSLPQLQQNLEVQTRLDLHRSYEADVRLRAVWEGLLDKHFLAAAGLSFSCTPPAVDSMFLQAGIVDIADTGLGFDIRLLGNEYPEYRRAVNTIQPMARWRYGVADLGLGVAWRFLVTDPDLLWCLFLYDDTRPEVFFQYHMGLVFDLWDGLWQMGISLANTDEFFAGNLGTFHLKMANRFDCGSGIKAFLDLVYLPAGTIALSAVNSAFAIKAGMEVSF